MRCIAALALIAWLPLVTGCDSKPSVAVPADGNPLVHPEARFTLIVPEGWQTSVSSMGVSLVRTQPYGGGYPTLNVRRVTSQEADVLRFKGSSFDNGSGRTAYRYQRWHNPRGSGYRLEALLDGDGGLLFADASVWDPATDLNHDFFEQAFWPIINSVDAR